MASLSSSSHSRKDHTSPSNQNGDGHGASKAVGTEENNSMNGSVTVSVPKKSRGAVLASFPQGIPPPETLGPFHRSKKAKTKDDQLGLGRIKLQYLQHHKRQRQQYIQGENKGFEYSAPSAGKALRDSVKYAVGIYDKTTKTVRLVQADNFFRLQQKMKHSDTGENLQNLTDEARRKMLIETFGSKMKRQAQRNREANWIDMEHVAGSDNLTELLMDTSQGDKNQSLEQLSDDEDDPAGQSAAIRPEDASQHAIETAAMKARKEYLPPFNVRASSPEQAYPVDLLITPDEGRGLKLSTDSVLKLMKKQNVEDALKDQNYCSVVIESLRHLANSKLDKKELKSKVRVHAYWDVLVKFYSAPKELRPSNQVVNRLNQNKTGDGDDDDDEQPELTTIHNARAIPALSRFSEYVGEKLLEKFTDKQLNEDGSPKYVRNKMLQDRLMMYIACCALHANSFTMDVKPLASELKLAPRTLIQYFKELGCTCKFVGENQSYQVKLGAPLQFPAQRRKRSRA